jgi:flagellar export protein FliJ
MRPFRFRAEPVLDLRRREEEAAATALARQRARAEGAWAAVRRARESVAEAGVALEHAGAAGSTHETLTWHRSWIARLRTDVQTAAAAATEADRASAVAAAALGAARQRRRVLERLRDRAWKAYCTARDRADLREMDHLATLRFAHQALDRGPTHDDHADHIDPRPGRFIDAEDRRS